MNLFLFDRILEDDASFTPDFVLRPGMCILGERIKAESTNYEVKLIIDVTFYELIAIHTKLIAYFSTHP